MLEPDGARALAVAAGGASPERFLGDDPADERRQVGLAVCEDRLALVEKVVLERIVHPLLGEGLAGEEGRAGVLATAAFGAGEGVEGFLPNEVGGRLRAHLHVLGGVVGHHGLEVHARHPIERRLAGEEDRRQRRHDVEVLASRQEHEEREHRDHLGPVARVQSPRDRVGRKSREGGRQGRAHRREAPLVRDAGVGRVPHEAEAVEEKIGDDDDEDEREDEDRLAVGLEALRPGDETPPESVEHRDEDAHLHEFLGRRVERAGRARDHRERVVADGDEVHLPHEERHEAQEDRRVHEARPPLAGHHARLAEAHRGEPRKAPGRRVPAHFRPERDDDRELAPGEHGEPGKAEYHQQRNRPGSHRSSPPSRASRPFIRPAPPLEEPAGIRP